MQRQIIPRVLGSALLMALLGVAGVALPGAAQAGVRWNVGIGVPFYGWGPGWGPGWYGYGYGYAPPPVVVQVPAPVQQPVPFGPPPPAYWYYCGNPAGYYPQVPACPGGWTAVPVQPTPSTPPPNAVPGR